MLRKKMCVNQIKVEKIVSGWLRWDILFLLVEPRCLYSLPEELIRCHLLFYSVHYIVHFDIDFFHLKLLLDKE